MDINDLKRLFEQTRHQELADLVGEICSLPVVQRLQSISYLGSFQYVFHGLADFSRWDHSLATSKLVAELVIAQALPLPEAKAIVVAALLHDIGHVYFSHIGESALNSNRPFSHEQRGNALLHEAEIRSVLARNGLTPRDLELVRERHAVLLDSGLDCDTLSGITQTAEMLGIPPPTITKHITTCLVWDGNAWTWNEQSIPLIIEFWDVKRRVYEKYVNDPRNLGCEAMLEAIIKNNTKGTNLLITDPEVLAKVTSGYPRELVDLIKQDQFFIPHALPLSLSPFEKEKQSVKDWKERFDDFLQAKFGWHNDDYIFREVTRKEFLPASESDLRQRGEWVSIVEFFKRHQKISKEFQICFHPRRDFLANEQPFQEFLGEYRALTKIEQARGWFPKSKAGKVSGNGAGIRQFRIVELHIDGNLLSKDWDWATLLSFTNLERLSLDVKGAVPPEVVRLKQLKSLELRGFGEGIPLSRELTNLMNLTELRLHSYYLQVVPAWISEFPALEVLEIGGGQLDHLPPEIGQCPRLREFRIDIAKLAEIPPELGQLASLETLILKDCPVHNLPSELGKLQNLRHLEIQHLPLEALPSGCGNWKSLQILEITGANLHRLPAAMGKMRKLRKLVITRSKLCYLPSSLGKLGKIHEVNFSGNRIKHLPSSLKQWKRVEKLRLDGNQLQEIPDWITGLYSLKQFDVHDNLPLRLPPRGVYFLGELFAKQNFHPSLVASIFPTDYIAWKRYKSGHRTFFQEIFDASNAYLLNVTDYVIAFIHSPTEFRPFLREIGDRAIPIISKILQLQDAPSTGLESYNLPTEIHQLDPSTRDLLREELQVLQDQKVKRNFPLLFVSIFESGGSKSYPLGALLLSACLKERNFQEIHYVEYVIEKEPFKQDEQRNNLHGLTTQYHPSILFLGPVFTPFLPFMPRIMKDLRIIFPDCFIIAGGAHFGLNEAWDTELLSFVPELDAIIVGESEKTIQEVGEFLYHERESGHARPREVILEAMGGIKGFKTRVNSKSFELREREPDLDTIPLSDFALLKAIKYEISLRVRYTLPERRNPLITTEDAVVGEEPYSGVTDFEEHFFYTDDYKLIPEKPPFAIISGSRSCPFKCSFCASRGTRRVRSATSIFIEMQQLYKEHDIKLFVFFDPLFTTEAHAELSRIKQLVSLLSTSDLMGYITYQVEIRADVVQKLPRSLLEQMISTGCRVINMGLEKGTNDALARFDKRMKVEDHACAIQKIREASRRVGKYVLINGTFILGGRGETREDCLTTIRYAFSLDIDGIAIFPLEIHPGTDLYTQAREDQVITGTLEDYLQEAHYPLYTNQDLPYTTLHELGRSFKEVLDVDMPRLHEQAALLSSHLGPRHEISSRYEDQPNVVRDLFAILKKCIVPAFSKFGRFQSEFEGEFDSFTESVEGLEQRFLHAVGPRHQYHTGDYVEDNLRSSVPLIIRGLWSIYALLQ